MSNTTLTVTCIMKDELKNLPDFLRSISGCCDAVFLTDTGSTDGSVEYAYSKEAEEILGFKPRIFHFEWINDFSAARNHALPFVETAYTLWLDLDDRLHNKEIFKIWIKNVMPIASAWYAKYDYAFDDKGNPVCSFVRERIFKTSMNYRFIDQVHEGVILREPADLITSWWVDHVRTDEELNGDKGRNLRILEEKKSDLSDRLKFYYGKELHDAGKFEEAALVLIEAIKPMTLSLLDRILGVQYLCWCLLKLQRYDECMRYAMIGLTMEPSRAEFLCSIADCYSVRGLFNQAIPWYQAAVGCPNTAGNGFSSIFTATDCYDVYPRVCLAKIWFHSGQFQRAKDLICNILRPDAAEVLIECEKALQRSEIGTDQVDCDDVVITTPPLGAYAWDGDIYRIKGIGGSETAAIEMAEWIHLKTGRQVIVFNNRTETVESHGVSYRPGLQAYSYFQKYKPKLSIQWRTPVKLTTGPSVLWCHDLITPEAEGLTFDYQMCLSPFHKNFVMGVQGLPAEKLKVTRNGIDPKRFKVKAIKKKHAKVIWPNSPDRGLEHAIQIMDIVQKAIPEATLHVFYGFENLEISNRSDLIEKAKLIKEMIKERSWVINHGNVTQEILGDEFRESEVWLYSASFIETFCITALEALLGKAWPVVRKMGALPDTLGEACEKKMCDILDLELHPETYPIWAQYVISAIQEQKWQRMQFDPDQYSWEGVASEWIKEFDL